MVCSGFTGDFMQQNNDEIQFHHTIEGPYRLGYCPFGCILQSKQKKAKVIAGDDTLNSGTIHISVDESFAPIIDSQIKVFMSLNPKARIIPHYKPEADCLKDMLNDSTRMIIITRGLSDDEELYYKDTLSFVPMHGRIATDAIAVITHNKAPDSLFLLLR